MENEFEKAKKFLKKIRWIDNEIDALIEDKEKLYGPCNKTDKHLGMDVAYIIQVVRTKWQK